MDYEILIPTSERGLKPIQTRRANGEEEEQGGGGEPLSPMARMFHEPGSNVYIISITGTKSRVYPRVAKAHLVNTVLRHPRFCSLQVFDRKTGNIKWVRTEVNLDDHVVVTKVDPNIESPDKFVEDYIFNLTKTTIDKSKPMWDFHLLDIKTTDGCEGVTIFRIHHSIGDGMSLTSLLLACSRKVSDPEALPVVPVMTKSFLSKSYSGFWSVMWLVWNTFVCVLLFVATALFLKDTKTPLKGHAGVENNPRRIIRRTVSMDDVKLVKKAMNVTINDVVLGVTQAGLSRYLNRRYGESKKDKKPTEKKNYLPRNIRLRATFFINIRPTAGIQDLADMMEKGSPARWGNKIGYVVLPFVIGFRDDPLQYIHEAKATIDRKKASLEPLCSYYFTKFLIKFFGTKVAGILNYRVFSNTTLWFSNVPGPQEEIALCGHEVVYYAPTCYGQPNALMIHVISYVNKLTFVISADEGTIPDPNQLCDDLEESLKLIKAAVLARQRISY